MKHYFPRIAGVLLLLGGLLAAYCGLLVPVHLQTQSPVVLQAMSISSEGLAERAERYLSFAQPGPTAMLLEAIEQTSNSPAPEKQNQLRQQLESALTENPLLNFSGGTAPFYEQFLKILPPEALQSEDHSVAAVTIPAEHRAQLLAFLTTSNNRIVQTLLETRRLNTVTRFMPVNTPAGAPLESAILTTALLVQSNAFDPVLTKTLQTLAARSLGPEDTRAVEELEAFYFAVLGASHRMNWLQLTEWVKPHTTWSSFTRMTTRYRKNPEQQASLYANVVYTQDPQAILNYLDKFPDNGWEDLVQALTWGEAVHVLLETQQALYQPPDYLAFSQAISLPEPFLLFCYNTRAAALTLVFALWVGAGILLSMGALLLFRRTPTETAPASNNSFLLLIRHSALGVLALVCLFVLSEPYLLEQRVSEPGIEFLKFELQSEESIIPEKPMNNAQLDQITILVLLIFLSIQLVIYTLCLIKLSQIKKKPDSARLKIKLLENEENLFDAGLYVGLSGTVISLLMLAMGIVQASLVAAYASTLFGIIFVAVLKIAHLRPLKHALILEADQDAGGSYEEDSLAEE